MEKDKKTASQPLAVEAKEKSKSNKGKVYIVISAVLAVAVFLAGFYFIPTVWQSEKHAYIEVKADMTGTEIADELSERELIYNAAVFRVAMVLTGQSSKLKLGEYEIDSHMSMNQIMTKLTSGASDSYRIVIPEGYTVRKIAKVVAAQTNISEEEFLTAASDASLLYPYMKGNRQVTYVTEGFLFPDTYYAHHDVTAKELVQMMLKNFDTRLTSSMRKKIGEGNLSIYQFVTLASLVEKEAKYDEDRPLIASVFQNRLKRHMKLQ